MKTLQLTLLIILLSGCSLFTSRLDNIEYSKYIKLLTMSETALTQCSDPNKLVIILNEFQKESQYLINYSKYRINNSELYNISTIIHSSINSMISRYNSSDKVSISYCTIKLDIIRQSLINTVQTIAMKPIN